MMLKIVALMTIVISATFLVIAVLGMFGGVPVGELGASLITAIISCSAIVLTLTALVRRSVHASRALFAILILPGLVALLCAWIVISPITVVGFGYLNGMSGIGWALLIAYLAAFSLPWLWAVISRQLRREKDLTNR